MTDRQAGFHDGADLLALAAGFAIPARPRSVSPLGQGLINATFNVETDGGDYVLQCVNAKVFPEPERYFGIKEEEYVELRRLVEQEQG